MILCRGTRLGNTKTFTRFMSPYHALIHLSLRFCRMSLRLGVSHPLKLDPPISTSFLAIYRHTHNSGRVPVPPLLTPPVNHPGAIPKRNASALTEVIGQSGCKYSIQRILQEKEFPTPRVYLARYVLIMLNYYGSLVAESWA